MSVTSDRTAAPEPDPEAAGVPLDDPVLDDPVLDNPVLDNPVWASLAGPHAHFAEIYGHAVRYPTDVAPFVALPDTPDEEAWRDLAALAGADMTVAAAGMWGPPPVGWVVEGRIPGIQMVDVAVDAASDSETLVLGPDDVPEMLDLVARTEPGPFRPRTIELGTYLGIRRGGVLVAMAGERMRPPGWTEISAVCTDHAYRGQGLAARLVRAVADGIRARGDVPFLHVTAANTNAIRLYEALGFEQRRGTNFIIVRTPSSAGPGG